MNLFRQIHVDLAPTNRCFCESAHDEGYFCTERYRISSAYYAFHRPLCGMLETGLTAWLTLFQQR